MKARTPGLKFLTADLANRAILHVAVPFFQGREIMVKRRMFHVVVIVPIWTRSTKNRIGKVEPRVLFEYSIGIRANWPYPFDEIAREKGYQLWHGLNDGGTDIKPHLLFPETSPFWGGVKRDGIVVACSGVEPWFDRMIAGMIADMIIGLCYYAWENSEDKKNDVCFLE